MRVTYACSGCSKTATFNGHPMTWGRFMAKKTQCCNRRWMIIEWGWPNGNDV